MNVMKHLAFPAAALLSFGTLSSALAGPTGGVVVEGQGTISSAVPGTTVIDQASQNLHLNWSTFDVGAQESVQFNQPSASAVALNRIFDQNPSQILGRIGANGQVILVNPNGLLIGRTAQLNVGSLVVSSLDVTGFDATTGRYSFGTSLASPGAVLNDGLITAGTGGSVSLLGGRVANTGTIIADFGTVNLAAGRAATLDLAGDGLLRLEVGDALAVADAAGSSAVENGGAIRANGGQVQLSAQALEGVFANLVNNTGVVRANRIDNVGGTIRLLGPGGEVRSSGTLDASAGDAVSTGGRVEMLGDRVGLFDNALVDVSGATGGGTALIGGDYQGKNPNVPNASSTYVGANAVIDADAGSSGDGGRIIVWADDTTKFFGHLSARGGAFSGNGGFAEVSGKDWLRFTGTANLLAPFGQRGTLLLDPLNITITNNADTDADLTDDGTYERGADPGDTSTIGNATIETLLAAGDVVLEAANNITQVVGADIDGTGAPVGRSLTLDATNNITLRADITMNTGDVVLVAGNDITLEGTSAIDSGGGTIDFSAGNDIDLQNGSILNGGAGLVDLTAGQNVRVTSITATGGVNITATGGAITDDSLDGTLITTSLLELNANETIGATNGVADLDTAITSLEALTNNGGMWLTELNGLTLADLDIAGDVILNAGGTIVATSVVSGDGNIALHTTVGNIQAASLNAFDTVTLQTDGGNIVDDGSDVTRIVANTVTLEGDSVGGAGVAGIDTSTANLNAEARIGSVDIDEQNGVTLVDVSATGIGSDVEIVAGGTMEVRDVAAGDDITLTATGAITDDGNPLTEVSGDVLTMTASTSIGTNGAPINTAVNQLNATANGGDLRIAEIGSVTLGTLFSTATTSIVATGSLDGDNNNLTRVSSNALTLSAGGSIGTPGNQIETTVNTLAATSGGGGIAISELNDVVVGDVNAAGGGNNVSLTAGGVIRDDGSGATVIGANLLTLNATALGEAAGNGALDTDVAIVDATSTNGGIYIDEADAITLQIVNAMGAGGSVVLSNATGALTASAVFASDDATLTATNGNLIAGNINVADAVSLTSTTGSILDDNNNGTQILANTLSLNAGTAIGSTTGNEQIDTNVATITATAGNGGIVIAEANTVVLADVSALGATSDVSVTNSTGDLIATDVDAADDISLTASAGNLVVGTVAAGDQASLTSGTGSIVDDANNTTRVAANTLSLNAVTGIGTGVANEEVDTNVASLSASATAGSVFIGESNAVTLTSVSAGGAGNDVVVTNTTGTVTATTVNAADAVTLTASAGNIAAGSIAAGGTATLSASAGAITDDGNDATVINGTAGVTLAAATGVGTVTDFTSATDAGVGSSIDVQTNGSLSATATSNTGQINLNISGAPTLAANAITLGSGAGRAGFVVLQSAGDLNVGGLAPGAINIGTGNTTGVGLRSGGTLTLPAAGGFTDQPASQLLVRGATDVVDNDGAPRALTFAANSLDFRSGAAGGATTLNTTVDQLAATIGNGQNFSVFETDGVALGSVSTTGDVTVSAGGDITDDGDPGSVTRVSGNVVTLFGSTVGAPASALDTQATTLNVNASIGDVDIAEADAVSLTANAGESVVVRTTSGSLTVDAVTAAVGVELSAGGAGSVLTVNGPGVTGGDLVALVATDANGSIVLNSTVASTSNHVILDADGAIVANPGHSISSAGVLFADGSSVGTSSARLNTAVAVLNASSDNGIYVTEADGLLNIDASAGTGAVDIETMNGLMGVSSASGSSITLAAGGAGSSITLNGQLNAGAGDVSLTAGTAGNRGAIVAGTGNLVTGDTLTAVGSTIGASGTPLNTTIASLDAVTTGGVFVRETNDLNVVNAQGGTGTVSVQTNDGAMIIDSVQGNVVALTTNGAGRDITVNGAVGATVDVALAAAGAGSDVILNGTLNAATVGISAGTASNRGRVVAGAGNLVTAGTFNVDGSEIGTSAARLNTDVDLLDAAGTNGVFVTEANALTITNAQGGAGDVSIETTNGAITVNTVAGDAVTLVAGGAGSAIVAGAGNQVTANTLTVTGSAVGTQTARLNTTVASLDATSTSGVFVTDSDALTVTNVVGGTGAVDVQTTNGALTAGAISGNSVTLAAGGAGSALNLNGAIDGGAGNVTLTAGTAGNRGAINVGANPISGALLTVSGSSVGSAGSRLNTNVTSLNATGTNGVFVTEADALTIVNAVSATGAVDVATTNGALTVAAASGNGITLTAGGAGSALNVNGSVFAGTGDVVLTAGTAGNRGAIVAGAGSSVSGDALTATGSSVGSSATQLVTNVSSLTADASNGGVFVSEGDGLTLASITAAGAGGNVSVSSGTGDIVVDTVTASGTVGLTASGGAISDDGDDTTRISGTAMTFSARSIGDRSTLTGNVLASEMRLDLDATSLNATSTSGGIFIDELNGLQSVSLNASGGAGGDIELLTATGDLNLLTVSASDALLLAAGHNIFVTAGSGPIVARVAELRAGAADSTQGQIGTLATPINLQLAAGDSLRLFVPQTVDPNDPSRAPSTLPSNGVNSALTRFTVPSTLAVTAGFEQFLGFDATSFTSPLESLVRTLQNQTQNVQTVLDIDWASFDSSVSLFGTLDPAVCLPGDQRDEEAPAAGC